MELKEKSKYQKVITFSGDIDALAPAERSRNIFNPEKVRTQLIQQELITGDEEVQEGLYGSHHPNLGLHFRKGTPKKGYFVVECYSIDLKRNCLVCPGDKYENGNIMPKVLQVRFYHALARQDQSYNENLNGAEPRTTCSVLEDLQFLSQVDNPSVGYFAYGDFNGPIITDDQSSRIPLRVNALEVRDWCIENLESTFVSLINHQRFRDAINYYRMLKTLGKDYSPRADFERKLEFQGRIPSKAEDIRALATQEHYVPALQEIVSEIRKNPDFQNLIQII